MAAPARASSCCRMAAPARDPAVGWLLSLSAAPGDRCPQLITAQLGDRTALYCTLGCPALQCTAPHCTELHCTTRHCSALHCTALYCTALHCSHTDQGHGRPETKAGEECTVALLHYLNALHCSSSALLHFYSAALLI